MKYYAENGPTGREEAELNIYMGMIPLYNVFFNSDPAACIYAFENLWQVPGGRYFYKGNAFITFLVEE